MRVTAFQARGMVLGGMKTGQPSVPVKPWIAWQNFSWGADPSPSLGRGPWNGTLDEHGLRVGGSTEYPLFISYIIDRTL
jgi:hypothetical protein